MSNGVAWVEGGQRKLFWAGPRDGVAEMASNQLQKSRPMPCMNGSRRERVHRRRWCCRHGGFPMMMVRRGEAKLSREREEKYVLSVERKDLKNEDKTMCCKSVSIISFFFFFKLILL